jgi:hypothetical protein
MSGLRQKIYEARKKLTATLEEDFNRRVTMRDLQRALITAEWQGKNLRAGDIIDALFEGKGIARSSSELLPIERKCFNDCIKLIKEAINALPT